jgi:glucose uptake protein GlcU
MIQTSIIFGSILAVIYIIIGGVTYMTTDSFSKKSEGKEYITNAIMGLVFLISGYLIFFHINPNILNLNLSAAQIDISADEVN